MSGRWISKTLVLSALQALCMQVGRVHGLALTPLSGQLWSGS